MDTARFFAELPSHFAGDPQEHDPIDSGWDVIAKDVSGFTSPNELAVLNLAARLLPAEECYLEVGTFKGRSLCGAVRDVAGRKFYAMENFMEFGMAGELARAELLDNLGRYAADADVELLEGDCFRLMATPGVVDRPVGVYFYDGEHTLLSHYLALAVAEPLLADETLVLVDDASWPVVQRAHRLFLKSHPGWSIEATWDAREADDPRWANGLHALVFRRTAPSRLSRRDEALRRYQVSVQDRVNAVAWKAAGVMPGVVKSGARLLLSRSRAIGGGQR
ncbi:class I SAM-dependent methyltransferase [Luteipulveratus sp. YIM 133132]|uniref:class I SAM-dependent methyltransferase n=1 Tax=Luteipulveratus flavus TaxID=3031728 RepID=UPI0023AEC446|nr:class I SAM-dependent methyltransferase [Luteipulveratus sp. YIM 133132]MDE9365990.1 class I SAM-dependent methyltransferase [Luteipulveratus sp. YIM 133132]